MLLGAVMAIVGGVGLGIGLGMWWPPFVAALLLIVAFAIALRT